VDELHSRYGSEQLPAPTERSITTLPQLEKALERVRADGYSTSCGESEPDVSAVGVAVRDRLGRAVGAISVSAPIDRLDRKLDQERIAEAAKRTADRIGSTLA
jgi:DNA-binding IclR family transcriptional regulator